MISLTIGSSALQSPDDISTGMTGFEIFAYCSPESLSTSRNGWRILDTFRNIRFPLEKRSFVVSTPSLGNLINLKKNKPEFGEGKFMFAESLETRCSKQSGYDVFSSIKILNKKQFQCHSAEIRYANRRPCC